MKRIVPLFLALTVCIALCACGRKQVQNEVDRLILNIGVVTLESKDAIEYARQSYEALTEEEKNDVEHLIILLNAEETFEDLVEDYVENAKTESKKEMLKNNPNEAIEQLEKVLDLDPSVQDDIDIIYGHCFDMNGVLFVKPSLLYTGVEMVAVSPHDSERELDGYFFAPIDIEDFYDYVKYAKHVFTEYQSKTFESASYVHYEFLDKPTGNVVLKLSLFSYGGELTIQVETVPQSRIHTS